MTTHESKTSTSVLQSHYQPLLRTVMAARSCDLDNLLIQVFAANGGGRLTDAEAQQLDDAVRARRAVLADRRREAARGHHLAQQKPLNGLRPLRQVERDAERRASIAKNRIKTFGMGRPKPMSSKIKRRLMERARALMIPTEPGKAYGELTPKFVAVLEALLFRFHNAVSGLCFPSYGALAEAADCARSTVALALKALEEAGLLSWDHRLKRVFETVVNLFGAVTRGQRSQVQRTSNGYTFFAESSESEIATGTTNPLPKKHYSLAIPAAAAALNLENPLHAALGRLGDVIKGKLTGA